MHLMLAEKESGTYATAAESKRIDGKVVKTNKIYQEVYNSQTQGGGDFDKQGGEQ